MGDDNTRRTVRFDGTPLAIEDVAALAAQQATAALGDAPAFRARIEQGAQLIERLLREEGVVYGVTTGYGDSCTVAIPPALVEEGPRLIQALP